ncbi:hypothetical protein JCM14469_10850 [Desulfatiferula olefinivorans]
MKINANTHIVILLTAAWFMLCSSTVYAKQAVVNPGAVKPNDAVLVPVKFKTDLVVESIHAMECLCSEPLERVNAMLYNDLWVTIGNWPCSGSKANATGLLQVNYFDESSNRSVTVPVPFSINGNSRKAIKIQSGPVLIKASSGVTARITRIDGNVEDCNPGNNSKTVRACLLPPIY